MAQHVIPAAQLVPQYKSIGRCNKYAVLQSIPYYPECKIRTVSKVPGTEDTIKFLLDTQQFTYTMDMFRDSLHLPVETPDNPFVAPANIHTIEAFMNIVGYQGVVNKVSAFFTKNLAQPWQTRFKVFNRCLTTRTSGHDQTKINILQLFHAVVNRTNVDYAALLWWDFINNVFQKKEAIQYPRFIKLIIADLMKKFPYIPKRLEEDYHSIKDDVLLVSVYTMENVLVRGMLISNALLTAEIRETDDFNENTTRAPRAPTISASPQETKKRKQTAGESSSRRIIIKKKKQSIPSIPPLGDDRERNEMAEATILSLTLHKTTLESEAKENVAKVQEMLAQEEIDKLVDGEEDEESSASAFTDIVLNDNDDGIGSKLEPESYKEHPEYVSDDDEKMKKDSAQKNEEVVTEKEVVDMSDKTISEELAATVTPTTATSFKTPSTTTRQKKSFSHRIRNLPGSIAGMYRRRGLIRSHIKNKFITRESFAKKIKEVLQQCNIIVPALTVTKTNEIIKKEMPRLVKLAVDKDREVSPVDIFGIVSKAFTAHATLNLYPESRSSTATKSSADL
ncbi:hypothetical protein Tco_1030410 [Tanacetum coccineum]|uniref:Uncharacterized protein n=1 Tax=Tanacetum coccineum TaxID=301880 RepID=A0ABQ5G6B4_9ASTR